MTTRNHLSATRSQFHNTNLTNIRRNHMDPLDHCQTSALSLDASGDPSLESNIAMPDAIAHNQTSSPQLTAIERLEPNKKGGAMTTPIDPTAAAETTEATKKYRVLLGDPPWSIGQLGKLGAIQHYDLMTLDRIKAMPISDLMLDDSWCFLWVTNNTLWEGPAVLKAWGFDLVKQPITWSKFRMGLGQPLRNSTEHLLLGRRGKPSFNFRGQPTHLIAPLQDHSHKPEEQFALIERFSDGPYLEIFARRRPSSSRDWSVWGTEISSDVSIPGFPVPSDFDDQEVR